MDVIFANGTREDFTSLLRQTIKEVIDESESKKVSPLTKVQACEQLGVSFNTLKKIMSEMRIENIFPSDIDRILLKYPKYIKKSIRA